MGTPFSRFIAVMSLAAAAISDGASKFDVMSIRQSYKSRGKGRASKPSKNVRRGYSGRAITSARQNARYARKLYMANVNGFDLIQSH